MTSKSNITHRKNSLGISNYGIDDESEQAYKIGKKIHKTGLGVCSISSTNPVKSAWMKAGWHDADMEAGNRVLQCDDAS